jgi:hypothetical protein
MNWETVGQVATLMVLATFLISGTISGIQRRGQANRERMADKAIEVAKAHAEVHWAHSAPKGTMWGRDE